MIPRCDLHLHTQFCDGNNTPEQMVEAAIRRGCTALGFSGHIPTLVRWDLDWCIAEQNITAYCNEIQRLKAVYANQIELLCGAELDYFSPTTQQTYDYTIGSVHYVKHDLGYIPIDSNYEILKALTDSYYQGNYLALARDFYDLTANIVNQTHCTIVGHFDLITKFNERYAYLDEENPSYQAYALQALDCLLEKNALLEINTGAMARAWRSVPYPAPFIMKRIAEKQGRLILSSDAHSAEHIQYAFSDATEYAKSYGVRELWTYQSKAFIPVSI